jgi:transposase
MFIRQTRKTTNGKSYLQHQLMESVRTPAGPRQRLLLNLGQQFDLPKDNWKELADAIEAQLHNQPTLFSCTPEITRLARHYSSVIIQQRLAQEEAQQKEQPGRADSEAGTQHELVDVQSLETSEVKTIGAEQIVAAQMEQYGLDGMLKSLEFSAAEIQYAKMLLASRLCHPGSERETVRWIEENSGIKELLGTDVAVYDNALHRTAVLLWEKHEELEQQLAQEARRIFSLKETLILYDLTNTYFEGSLKGSSKAKHGKSKDKRNDRVLIALALTLDEQGFPKRSKIYEGNVVEPDTLEEILSDLSKQETEGFQAQKTVVIDAGIATQENLELLQSKGFKYVAVSRQREYEEGFWDQSEEKELTLADGRTGLRVKAARTEKEIFVLCQSEAKRAKEQAILDRRLAKFEEGLQELQQGLAKKRTLKSYDKIMERIGRLKERYGVGNLYTLDIKQENSIVQEISFSRNAQATAKLEHVGQYVLRSNRLDLSDAQISELHRSLTRVEDSFRSMKSHLGLRPNFHKREDTSIAHIFITVIAYHLLAAILKKLQDAGISHNWSTIRNMLATHVRVTTTFNMEGGDTLHIRNSTVPTSQQQNIYSKLQMSGRPLKKLITKVPLRKKEAKG